MSRIDEALSRSSGLGSSSASRASDDAAPSFSDESALAHYPREARAESDRATRPLLTAPSKSVPSQKTIAAPRVGLRGQLSPFAKDVEGKLVLGDAQPYAVEQYRRLAATVHQLQTVDAVKTLMVASALPCEGKTLTVTNLALTLSESYGRRVLLIDADLRRPSVHEIFRLPNTRGLSEVLRSGTGDLPVLQVSPRLSIVPGGRPDSNPMAGLTSDRMRGLLREASSTFDWVLVDSPPVGIMPDAHLLARLTQGVIFVIAAGSTPFTLVDRSINEIGRDNIIGTVLNRIEQDSVPSTSYYHYYQEVDRPTE